uniref:Menorin-like domain-containing protein n=1 Tax=Anopheles minimus TaxID=112268 RepID=A0A182W9W4_9DIPT
MSSVNDLTAQLLSTANSGADAKANLTTLTWAHAVNDAEFLTRVLASDIQFIEADISLGYLKDDVNKEHEIPIMAHPPATESDISLETFLTRILQYNRENAKDTSKVKGVKLDFKSIGAFEGAINILRTSYDMNSFDTWINADILPGPVDNTATIPVDSTRFFAAAKRLGKATLSIGWTTRWGADFADGSYTDQQIDAMISAIRANNIEKAGNAITFPNMGLPDLPGQPEDDSNFTMDENNTVHLEPLSEDESDNESFVDANGYAGYQPLNMDEQNQTNRRTSLMEDELESGATVGEPAGADAGSTTNAEFLNVDVWNAPRPNELSIELDSSKAAEIVNVMAGIKLPTTAVPDWARGVPEEEWKENLLQRIRQRQQTDVDDGCSTSFTMASGIPTVPNSGSTTTANSSSSHTSRRT